MASAPSPPSPPFALFDSYSDGVRIVHGLMNDEQDSTSPESLAKENQLKEGTGHQIGELDRPSFFAFLSPPFHACTSLSLRRKGCVNVADRSGGCIDATSPVGIGKGLPDGRGKKEGWRRGSLPPWVQAFLPQSHPFLLPEMGPGHESRLPGARHPSLHPHREISLQQTSSRQFERGGESNEVGTSERGGRLD